MDIDIYIDVVFLINLVMDMLVFWIAGRLARKKTTALRLTLGAGVSAALYCGLAFLPFFDAYYNFFTTLFVLMAGLLICYKPKTAGEMLILAVYSNIAAFAIGGAAFGIFYYTNLSNIIGSAVTSSENNLTLKILIATSAASYLTIKLMISRFNRTTVKKQALYKIKIFIDEKEIGLVAMLDTGNSLLDPLTSEPVIIVEFSGLMELLPDNICDLFIGHREEELLELMNAFSKTSYIKRVRIIPYSSLGKQNGMLIGIKPDSVQITRMETDDITTKEAIVGIYNYSLSADGSFQALLNPNIFA